MGLYPVNCPECGEAHMWFSGTMDQRCTKCKTTYTPRCPICKKPTTTDGNLAEDGTEECPDDHYWYNHSYGCHETVYDVFGDGNLMLSTRHHYAESQEEHDARAIVENAFINYAKLLNAEKVKNEKPKV